MNCFLIPQNGTTYRNVCPISIRIGKQKALRSLEARDERPIVANLYRGFADYLILFPEKIFTRNPLRVLSQNCLDVDIGSHIRAT